MRQLTMLLFIVLVSVTVFAQDDYQKLIQAALKGDTALAGQILKNSVKTEPVKEKTFPIKNDTEHFFKIDITALRDSIISFFEIKNDPERNKFLSDIFYRRDYYDDDTARSTILLSAESIKDSVFSGRYYSQTGTSNDVFLTVFHEAWESKLYYSKDYQLNYTTDFALQLSEVGNNLTKVKVVALSPKVINGMSLGAHGTMNEYAQVHPTTIEEYSLLLFIADKLGDKTLSPLKLPNK